MKQNIDSDLIKLMGKTVFLAMGSPGQFTLKAFGPAFAKTARSHNIICDESRKATYHYHRQASMRRVKGLIRAKAASIAKQRLTVMCPPPIEKNNQFELF